MTFSVWTWMNCWMSKPLKSRNGSNRMSPFFPRWTERKSGVWQQSLPGRLRTKFRFASIFPFLFLTGFTFAKIAVKLVNNSDHSCTNSSGQHFSRHDSERVVFLNNEDNLTIGSTSHQRLNSQQLTKKSPYLAGRNRGTIKRGHVKHSDNKKVELLECESNSIYSHSTSLKWDIYWKSKCICSGMSEFGNRLLFLDNEAETTTI